MQKTHSLILVCRDLSLAIILFERDRDDEMLPVRSLVEASSKMTPPSCICCEVVNSYGSEGLLSVRSIPFSSGIIPFIFLSPYTQRRSPRSPPSLSAAPSGSETAETAARPRTSRWTALRSALARRSPFDGSPPPSPREDPLEQDYVKKSLGFYPKAGVAEALRACCSRSMVSRMVFRRTWVSSRRRLRSSLLFKKILRNTLFHGG